MIEHSVCHPSRRDFIRKSALAAGVLPWMSMVLAASPSSARSTVRSDDFGALVPFPEFDESQATAALVDALCPEDDLTPSGTICGLAMAVRHTLNGKAGESASFQSGMNIRQSYRMGLEWLDDVSRKRFALRFADLDPGLAKTLLMDARLGGIPEDSFPAAQWTRRTLQPVLVRASLFGSIHDRYSHRVFWKLIAS